MIVFNPETVVIERRRKHGENEEIEKPIAVVQYTKKVGAVDRFDHYSTNYSFTRKSLKWWKKTFFLLFEVAVINSYIFYKQANKNKNISHTQYRKEIIS